MSALHRAQTSLLPKANEPYANKAEGRNKAEKELAVADHELSFVICAKVTIESVAEVNVTRMILSRAARERNARSQAARQRIDDRMANLFR